MKRTLHFLVYTAFFVSLFSSAFAQTSQSQPTTITITGVGCPQVLAINPPKLPQAVADGKTPYTYTFTAVAPVPPCVLPLKWSISAGALPVGLALSATTGVLSGVLPLSDCTAIPPATCSDTFTVTVMDSGTTTTTTNLPIRLSRSSLPIFGAGMLVSDPFAQEAKAPDVPTLSPQLQVELFKAQHEKDAVAKQKADLSAQLAQIQNQANAQYSQIAEKEKAAAAKFEEVRARAMTGLDPKKWELDLDTMQPKAVSQPAPTPAPPAPSAAKK